MSFPELVQHEGLRDRWVAIDPNGAGGPNGGRGRNGSRGEVIVALRSGAVVVDCDEELAALCARIDRDRRTSLTIVFCGDRPQA